MRALAGFIFCSCAVLITAAPEYLRSYHGHYSGADDTPKEYQNMDQQVQQAIQRTMQQSQSGQYRSGYTSGHHTSNPYEFTNPYDHDDEDDGQHTEDIGHSFGSSYGGSRYSSNRDEDLGQQKEVTRYGSSGYTSGGSSRYSGSDSNRQNLGQGSSGYMVRGTSYSSNRGDEHEDLGQQREVLGYSGGSSSYGSRGTLGSRDNVRQSSSGYAAQGSGYASNTGNEREYGLGQQRENVGPISGSSGYTSRGTVGSGYSHIGGHNEEDNVQQKETLGYGAGGTRYVSTGNSESDYAHSSGSLDQQGRGIQSGSFTRGSGVYGSSNSYGSGVSQSGYGQSSVHASTGSSGLNIGEESVTQSKDEDLQSTLSTTGSESQTGRVNEQKPGYVRLSTILNNEDNPGSSSTVTQSGIQSTDSEDLGQQVQTAIFSNTDNSQSETSYSSHSVLSDKRQEITTGSTANNIRKISAGNSDQTIASVRPETVTHEVNTDNYTTQGSGENLTDAKSLIVQTDEQRALEESEKRLMDLLKHVNQGSDTAGSTVGSVSETNKQITGAQGSGSDHYLGAASGSYANVHRHYHSEPDFHSPHTSDYHLGPHHTREYHMGPIHHTKEYHMGFDGTDDDDDSDFHHHSHHGYNPHGTDDDEPDYHHHSQHGHNPHYMVHGPHHHYVVPGTNKHEDGSDCQHDVQPDTGRTTMHSSYSPTSSTSKPSTDSGINIRNTFANTNRGVTQLEVMDQTLGNRRQSTQEQSGTSLGTSTNRATTSSFGVSQQGQSQLFTNLDEVSQQRQGQIFTNEEINQQRQGQIFTNTDLNQQRQGQIFTSTDVNQQRQDMLFTNTGVNQQRQGQMFTNMDNVRQTNGGIQRQNTGTGTFFVQENSAQDMTRVNAQNDQLLAILENARRNQARPSSGPATGFSTGSSAGTVTQQGGLSSGSQFGSSTFQTGQSQITRNQNTTGTTSLVNQINESVEDNGQQIQGFGTSVGANQVGSQTTLQNSRDDFTQLTTQQSSGVVTGGSNTRTSEGGRQDLSVTGLNQNEQSGYGFSSNSGSSGSTYSHISSGSQVQGGQNRGDQPLSNINDDDNGQVIIPAFGGSGYQQSNQRVTSGGYGGTYGSAYSSGSYGNSASSSNVNYETQKLENISKDDAEDLGQQQVIPVFGRDQAQGRLLQSATEEDTQKVEDIRKDSQQVILGQDDTNISSRQSALPDEEVAKVSEIPNTTTEKPGFWKRLGSKVTNLFSKSS